MPEITRFGAGKAGENTGTGGVTWFDINLAIDADREWLMAWQDISEQTRAALLEPTRFSHYEHVPDGTLLSIRALRTSAMEDLSELADVKLLIGPSRAITLRSGKVVAVDQLRENLPANKSLVTAVDLLGFFVTGMANRMEPIISDLTQDIDDIEDAMLDGGLMPHQQTLSEFQRRIVRTRRHVNSSQQVLDPMTTDPTLAFDAEDRETLVRASKHVTRYLQRLDECRTRVQTLGTQIEAQRSEMMTRSSFNLSIVATVFLPLTFITGLLGMNVAGIPDQHNPNGFWVVTGLSIIISILAWLLLRRHTYGRQKELASAHRQKAGQLPDSTSRAGSAIRPEAAAEASEQSVPGDSPPTTRDPALKPGGQ